MYLESDSDFHKMSAINGGQCGSQRMNIGIISYEGCREVQASYSIALHHKGSLKKCAAN